MDNNMNYSAQRGYNLLEVLIAIAIFAIGMLALASLQGSLTRSGADANFRTVAVNIAERTIEVFRGFAAIDSGLGVPAYNDIVAEGPTDLPPEVGITFTRTIDVTDYYYVLATDNFSDTAPAGIAVSDFKLVEVTVAWGDNAGFRIDQSQDALSNADLNSGEITLSAIVSSVTTQGSARGSTQEDENDFVPFVNYEPGQNPDIVSLSLGDDKFKESLLPRPEVIREGELVETRFDVITYSQPGDGALFLRREEFIAISCECTIKAPPGDAPSGSRRPTVWAGDEYAEGHYVDKPYGLSANNQQSEFCGLCCQDHHDGGTSPDDHADTAVNKYDPFRPAGDYLPSGTFGGDHKHYNRVQQGNNPPTLVLAELADDNYLETCKLVRKDGFFRVAQDFRQEDLHVFPEDFLDDDGEIDTYSAYVTGAADAFEDAALLDYETDPPCIGGPSPCVAEPTYGADFPVALVAGEFPVWTPLVNPADDQQLRSRGVYVDYLSFDVREVIGCLRAGDPIESCSEGDVILDRTMSANILEIIPFFDVQLTWLHRWNETPTNMPVDTTNEGLESDNTHSRGLASRNAIGCSDVESKGHRGNLGFTDTASIDNNFIANLRESIIDVESLDPGGLSPCALTGLEPVVIGEISETVNGLQVTDIEVQGLNGALCDRTPTGFECTVSDFAVDPRVKVFGYGKNGSNRWACMLGANRLDEFFQDHTDDDANTIFNLFTAIDPQPDGTGYDVNVQSNSCPIL